ncbi:hypothetical protein [Butyrivibrio sp. INlla14]|uniref:hypothetical protein n=1 Tax=Butyrivibrio sp. INlla14 TaxID=1520808 RepID=UPI0008765CE4|nr:hypothetical protein [Butyrivibrio sp. INlla14]SCY62744.1 hypothetical protein SAMN02910371_03087 [Butyrivibrio sp. INlla14]
MSEVELPVLKCPKEEKPMVTLLCAYALVKELHKDGKITDRELDYIRKKNNIPVE